jgi:hypothetical protein
MPDRWLKVKEKEGVREGGEREIDRKGDMRERKRE